MKKSNYFLFAAAIAILIFASVIGVSLISDSSKETAQPKQEKEQEPKQEQPATAINLPQLTEERADAATMGLISAPTLQPVDHLGRWNPQLGKDSCLMCHQDSAATGAREIPIDHFVDEDRSEGIFGPRNQCITCHGLDSGDTKPAFNREN
ncbi:nitrate reductase cytochrome c-type subunit [Bacillaceae bacterium IKA-2]|nr:nitrate reductase cytochrome c-type subunit [Bacillaceae bacterium IKA-2]